MGEPKLRYRLSRHRTIRWPSNREPPSVEHVDTPWLHRRAHKADRLARLRLAAGTAQGGWLTGLPARSFPLLDALGGLAAVALLAGLTWWGLR